MAFVEAVLFDVDFTLIYPGDERYHHELFVRYTAAIIEGMGGAGGTLKACAREMYDEWALCHHFHLYDDVRPVLQRLAAEGIKVGLVSNSHRCLDTFQGHFGLDGLIHAAVSSSEHGYLKPHPSIFRAALSLLSVSPAEAIMIGDSYVHDVEGARAVGMKAVLLRRAGPRTLPQAEPEAVRTGTVPVISSLLELPGLL